MHVQNTTNDVWIYDNPPEGFPPAINATCNWFIGFAAGQEQPIGGSVTCQAVDPNGEIALFNGTFQPDGTVMPVLIAGTEIGQRPSALSGLASLKTIQAQHQVYTLSHQPIDKVK